MGENGVGPFLLTLLGCMGAWVPHPGAAGLLSCRRSLRAVGGSASRRVRVARWRSRQNRAWRCGSVPISRGFGPLTCYRLGAPGASRGMRVRYPTMVAIQSFATARCARCPGAVLRCRGSGPGAGLSWCGRRSGHAPGLPPQARRATRGAQRAMSTSPPFGRPLALLLGSFWVASKRTMREPLRPLAVGLHSSALKPRLSDCVIEAWSHLLGRGLYQAPDTPTTRHPPFIPPFRFV